MIFCLIVLARHNYIAALILLPLFVLFFDMLRKRETKIKKEFKSLEANNACNPNLLSSSHSSEQKVLKTSLLVNLPITILKQVIVFYLSSAFGHEKYASEDIKNINLTAQYSQENDSIIRVALLEAVDQYSTKIFLFININNENPRNCYLNYIASKEIFTRFYLPLFLNKDNIEEEIKKDRKKSDDKQAIGQPQAIQKLDDSDENPPAEVVVEQPKSKSEDADWDEETKKYYQIYLKAFVYFEENYLNVKWESLCDDKKFGLVAHKYDDSQGRRTVKSVIQINKPIKVLYEYLKNLENKGKFDSSYEKGYIQKTLNENLGLIHLQYKGKIAFSPRDFMVIVYSKLHDNFARMFACSYPSDESTHVKGVVRGNVIFSYYNMIRVDEAVTTLEFYCLSENQLSQTLVNMVLKDLAYTLREIKKLIEK